MFLHVDVDSFFASAERSVDPSLNGVPMAVGSRSNLEIFEKDRIETRLMNENSGAFVAPVFYTSARKSFEEYFVDEVNRERRIRGIITSASYEARACGVKTAMPVAQALRLCPEMIVIPSRYRLYHTLSQKLYGFMCRKIPQVEQYSIDEFFGDVSGWIKDEKVYRFAVSLKEEIYTHFGLPVSIGIAKAKWIAKLATESAKPFGVYEVNDIDAYIESIPVEAFPGIGKGFHSRLAKHYIKTLGDLKRNRKLLYSWKKPGIQLYGRVTGSDNEKIEKRGERKSIGISRTFDPIYESLEVRRRIMIMARHITFIAMKTRSNPTTFYLKIHYEYGIKVKKRTTLHRLFSEQLLKRVLSSMYEEIKLPTKGAIKLTINLSNFTQHHYKTLSLMEYTSDRERRKLSQEIHQLRERFGLDIVKSGGEL